MSGLDRRGAFKAERSQVLAFCDSLGPADWRMDSNAEGWSIKDVVAHMGSGCHALLTPQALKMMRSSDIEQANDSLVDSRRDRLPHQVLDEYRRWSRLAETVIPALARTPLGRVQTPLAQLGRFPMRLLLSALVFDHHTHLRHDMAPALGLPAPGTDANRMAVALEWIMAVLDNQLRATRPIWLDRPLSITLTGPGGGLWRVESSGAVTPGCSERAAAQITGVALEFPAWGTRRAAWRDRAVDIAGDADYGAMFLDEMNIV